MRISSDAIAPPDIDAHDQWFTTAEDFLLSTLDNKVGFEAITNALEQFAAPTHQPMDSPPEGLSILKNGIVAGPLSNRSFSDLFALLRTANHSISMPRQAFGGQWAAATANRSDFVADECLTRLYSPTC